MTKTDKEVRADREISYVAEVIQWDSYGEGHSVYLYGFRSELLALNALDKWIDDPLVDWLHTSATIKEYIGNIFIRKTYSLGFGPQG